MRGSVETTTRTTLSVKLSAIAISNVGTLEAFVTIEDENLIYRRRLSGDMIAQTNNGTVSQTRQVATVIQAAPYLYSDEVTLMKSTGDRVTIRGVGFSLSENDNVVILYPAGGLPSYAPTGRVVNSTFTRLVYSFDTLHPENGGPLSAAVVVNTLTSNQVVSVTVVPCPVIDSSLTNIYSNTNEITISGRGFYTSDPSKNYIRFPKSDTSIAEAAGFVREVGHTYIVVSFTELSQHNYHQLDAIVSINKSTQALLDVADPDQVAAIGDLDSKEVPVAYVNPTIPILSESNDLLSSDSLRLTIHGTGFSGKCS